jgi:Cu/Ag efflux pump CusA
LKDGHARTADYVRKPRTALPAAFPEEQLFFLQAADMVKSQISVCQHRLTCARLATIGRRTCGWRKKCSGARAAIPGVADAQLQQGKSMAGLLRYHRARRQLGLNAANIANNLTASLSSSEQARPTDRSRRGAFLLSGRADAGAEKVASLTILAIRRSRQQCLSAGTPVPGVLSNVATFKRTPSPPTPTRAISNQCAEVYASIQGRDLGGVASDINKVVADLL